LAVFAEKAEFRYSYRMRQHTDLWHALHTPDPEPPSNRRRRPRQEAETNWGSSPRRTVRFSTGGIVRFWLGVDKSNDAVVIRRWVGSTGTIHALAPSGGSGGNGLPVDVFGAVI